MSNAIKAVVTTYLVEHGRAGKIQLSKKLKCHEATINRWLQEGIPGQHEAYKLARACGCTRDEALRLARDASLPLIG